MGGDSLSLPYRDRLPVHITWRRGAGTLLRVLDQRDTLLQQMVGSADGTIETDLRVAESLYVRAELRAEGGAMRAMTNPIYLERMHADSPGSQAVTDKVTVRHC